MSALNIIYTLIDIIKLASKIFPNFTQMEKAFFSFISECISTLFKTIFKAHLNFKN